jgi:hypothetical protein
MNKQTVLATSVALISVLLVLIVANVSPWLRLAGVAVAVLLALKLSLAVRSGRRDVGHVETSLRRWTRVGSNGT